MPWFKVKPEKIRYLDPGQLDKNYTEKMNKEYDWMSRIYGVFLFFFPVWKKWIKKVLPHIQGKKVLEVSFGNGYLMSRYAGNPELEVTGIDYNQNMVEVTSQRLAKKNLRAELLQANVEKLPFPDKSFDTIINTMAFTGYPDGDKALAEIRRVLKDDGRLLLVDFDYPADRNIWGYSFVRLWEKMGDFIKDIPAHLARNGFDFEDRSVGGWGSVHLYLCTRKKAR